METGTFITWAIVGVALIFISGGIYTYWRMKEPPVKGGRSPVPGSNTGKTQTLTDGYGKRLDTKIPVPPYDDKTIRSIEGAGGGQVAQEDNVCAE